MSPNRAPQPRRPAYERDFIAHVVATFGDTFKRSMTVWSLRDLAVWHGRVGGPSKSYEWNTEHANMLANHLIANGAPLRALRKALEYLETECGITNATATCIDPVSGKVDRDAVHDVADNIATPQELHELLPSLSWWCLKEPDRELTLTWHGVQLVVADALPSWPRTFPLEAFHWKCYGALQDQADGTSAYVLGSIAMRADDIALELDRLAVQIAVCRVVLQAFGHPASFPVVVHLFLPLSEAVKVQQRSGLHVEAENVQLIVHGL